MQGFSDYYDSLVRLREAANERVNVQKNYTVEKYCKIPLYDASSNQKVYVALKPRDLIKIHWEYDDHMLPSATSIVVPNGDRYKIFWSNKKFFNWVLLTASEN